MNILIIGSGGREHALSFKLAESALCKNLYIAPGNPGTAQHGLNLNIKITEFELIAQAIKDHEINMVIIGPEDPLVAGITDYLELEFAADQLIVIGPTKEAAMLEGSKSFAKIFMQEFGIPTAAYRSFEAGDTQEAFDFIDSMELPIVVKADGLAAGKGVIIAESREEAKVEIEAMFGGKFEEAGHQVVLEEYLSGREFSVFVLTDGKSYKILPVAKDYKKIGEGDTGPNTGGMGAISPVAFVDDAMMKKVISQIIEPTLKGIKARKLKYHGFIFFGLIEVKGEPYVIEYNCRLGDPETEVILPRLKTDLIRLLVATHYNALVHEKLEIWPQAAATVMLVSGGYPGLYEKFKPVSLPYDPGDSIIFHSGTHIDHQGRLVSMGGRVLAVTSIAENLEVALNNSYDVIESIHFTDMYYRRDIGS